MTSVHVKDVPQEVHAELRRRAAARGQSMPARSWPRWSTTATRAIEFRRHLVEQALVAAESLDLEVGSAIRRFEASGQPTPQRLAQAVDDLRDLAIDRVPMRRPSRRGARS